MISKENMDLERRVVLEELAMYEDSPEDLCADYYYENAWAGSMLGSNILEQCKGIGNAQPAGRIAHAQADQLVFGINCFHGNLRFFSIRLLYGSGI